MFNQFIAHTAEHSSIPSTRKNQEIGSSRNFHFSEIKILGIRFHRIIVRSLLNYIGEAALLSQKTIIGIVNIRAMNFAQDLPWYRAFINQADLVFCDGFGVLLGAKLKGYPVQKCHRMTAPDFFDELVLLCEEKDISIFLLAGEEGVVETAISKLNRFTPNLKVDGHHGYFDKEGPENDRVIEKINEFKPDILYVGFGMPLQEKWIWDNRDRIETHVFLPLGACLDFYTGKVDRGPKFMTENGFEWLSRLITSPRKLWVRYVIGNPRFFFNLFREMAFFS